MGRISIDVTDEQHQRLKALAALKGKSMKQLVLESTLGGEDPEWLAFIAILEERIRRHETNPGPSRPVEEIFEEARQMHRDGRRPSPRGKPF